MVSGHPVLIILQQKKFIQLKIESFALSTSVDSIKPPIGSGFY